PGPGWRGCGGTSPSPGRKSSRTAGKSPTRNGKPGRKSPWAKYLRWLFGFACYWPPPRTLDAPLIQAFDRLRRRQFNLFDLFAAAGDLARRTQDVLDIGLGLVEVA